MDALIPFVALVSLASLGLLAHRFGADSRPTIRSDEHRLATTGMVWDVVPESHEPDATSPDSAAVASGPVVSHVVWTPAPAARSERATSRFPILLALDRAREGDYAAFATDADAEFLEQRARHLIDRHWSERVWLTGFVDQARFDRLCATLERERQGRREAKRQVDELELSDRSSSIAS